VIGRIFINKTIFLFNRKTIDSTIEVTDQFDIFCEAPNIEKVFNLIGEITSLSTDLQDKINALS